MEMTVELCAYKLLSYITCVAYNHIDALFPVQCTRMYPEIEFSDYITARNWVIN